VILSWTPEALDDWRAIYEYIEINNPGAALAGWRAAGLEHVWQGSLYADACL